MYKEVYNQFYKDNKWKYIIYMMLYKSTLKTNRYATFLWQSYRILNKKDTNSAAKLLLLLLGIWIVLQILNLTKEYLYTKMWPKLIVFTEQTLFKKIIDSYNTNFKELNVGELVTKLVKMLLILDEIIYYVHFFSENVIMMISN